MNRMFLILGGLVAALAFSPVQVVAQSGCEQCQNDEGTQKCVEPGTGDGDPVEDCFVENGFCQLFDPCEAEDEEEDLALELTPAGTSIVPSTLATLMDRAGTLTDEGLIEACNGRVIASADASVKRPTVILLD